MQIIEKFIKENIINTEIDEKIQEIDENKEIKGEIYYIYYARVDFRLRKYINRELVTYPIRTLYKIGITKCISKRKNTLEYYSPWRSNPKVTMLGFAVYGCKEIAYLIEQEILNKYEEDRYKDRLKLLKGNGTYEMFNRDVFGLDK